MLFTWILDKKLKRFRCVRNRYLKQIINNNAINQIDYTLRNSNKQETTIMPVVTIMIWWKFKNKDNISKKSGVILRDAGACEPINTNAGAEV